MIETGRKLQDRYRIARQIGQGGMGSVYIATDERFGSTVAIKETLCMDDNYRKAIEREARLLNSLKHTALPKVTDHFVEDNGQFLVMEYIPGDDLSVALETRTEPFPVSDVLDWADQLLDALDFLHNLENPVIHRDIKPQNLKISEKGRITLLDFGLAKGNITGAGTQTNAKSIFGYSRNYASLEQIQGTGTDPRSDLYSLAATLYHLLTLSPPEDALTRAMAVLSQKADPLIPANLVSDKVPPGVAAILHQALDLDAAERPATAAVMREMLKDHERYAGAVLSTVSVARAGQTDIHTRKTELMPGLTRGETHPETYAPPARVSQGDSIATSVRAFRPEAAGPSGASNAPQRSGGRKIVYTVAALGLLLLGVAGTTLYLGYPLSEPDNRLLEVPVVETLPSPMAANESEDQIGAEAASNAEEPLSEQRVATNTKKAEASHPKNEASRADASSDPDGVVVKEDQIKVGNIKIVNGKVHLPDGRVYPIDEETQRELSNMSIPNVPDWRDPRLTPRQRRRLRMLRERYPDAFPRRTPSSPPTPPDNEN